MSDLNEIEEALSEPSVYNETWLEWDFNGHWIKLSRAAVGASLDTPVGPVIKVHEEYPDDESRRDAVMVFLYYDEYYRVTGYADSYGSCDWHAGCQRVHPTIQPIVVYKTEGEINGH